MRRRVLAALAWAALGFASAPAAGQGEEAQAAAPTSAWSERLDAALEARALTGSRSAALVVARDDGQVLYAHDPDRPLVPASNQKILTAVAALRAFGPTHRFTTEVFAEPLPDAEGWVDRLAIRGGGDPALTSEDLWRLAADLRRRGLRGVRTALVLDDSAFDREHWHPSWGPVSARAYHAPVGALNVNYGAFVAAIRPGAAEGDPVEVFLDPPVPYFQLVSRGLTGAARGRDSLVVTRSASEGGELVQVSGALRLGSATRTLARSALDPAGYAGAVIRMQLEALGIEVAGPTLRGPVPPAAEPLLEFQGKPLAEIVRLFVKFSNNSIAESLVKSLGLRAQDGPGSWQTGIPALRRELRALGLDTEGLQLVDGSGLSYDNRLTPRALVDVLRLAGASFRFGPELESALPIANGDGTLEERAEGAAHAVRAKTGLLTRVTGLSGYARLGDGREVIFSVLTNGYRGSAERAMAALDGFVAELVR